MAGVFITVSPLQDQIDTLTFQKQSLKAKADRFEEALKEKTEEQLKVNGNYIQSHHTIQWIAIGSRPRSRTLRRSQKVQSHHFLILLLFLYSFIQHL